MTVCNSNKGRIHCIRLNLLRYLAVRGPKISKMVQYQYKCQTSIWKSVLVGIAVKN